MSINSGIKKQKKYIADENGNHTLTSLWTSTDTVEDSVGNTLTELLEQIGDPTVTVVASEESGIAKRYTIYQGGTAVSVPIDIPLDMVIQSGSLVDITFHDDKLWDGATDVTALIMPAGQTPTSANAGKYIKLVIANSSGDIIYISLLDLTFTDENVAQTPASDNSNYEILFSGTADNTAHTEGTKKSDGLKYNPSKQSLSNGFLNNASGYYSHAEGEQTTASGANSHSEGSGNTASGDTAHAEGGQNYASGTYSHVEGTQNEATHYCQHVLGMFNELDPSSATADSRGTYVEIVGNGTNGSNRSNARTLDWDGNETLAGTLTANDVINTGYWDGINTSLKTAIAYSKTASGTIASFDDGSTMPLKTLQVSIEPVQDLHGYDAPWVGGSQKNKLPQIPSSYTSGDVLVDYGSEKTFNGYALSFKFSGSFANGGASFLVGKDSSDTNIIIITPQTMKKTSDGTNLESNTTYTNESVYFVSSATVNIRKFVLYTYPSFTNPVFIDCQYENGNTVTTYAPYENICPISGWTECNVTVCDDVDNPTVENEYTIEFTDGTNPLTVYGGTLDVTSGVLTVDRYKVKLSDVSDWTDNVAFDNTFNGEGSVLYNRARNVDWDSKCACDSYKGYTSLDVASHDSGIALANSTSAYDSVATRIYVKDSRFSSYTDFVQSLQTNDIEVVFPLATPQTYNLTPTQVNSILAQNNVFADTGNVLNCEYVPNNLIAKIEKDIIDNSGAQTNINYSTTEQDTGLKWIDGRPIYQKTYYLSTYSSTIDSSFTPDIYDNYWQTFVFWKYVTDGNHYVGSMFGGQGGCIYTESDSRGLLSANFTGVTPEDIYITIQYTKTADIVTP